MSAARGREGGNRARRGCRARRARRRTRAGARVPRAGPRATPASRGDVCPPKPQNPENDETPVETRAGLDATPERRDDGDTERPGRCYRRASSPALPPAPSSRARGRFRFRHAERRIARDVPRSAGPETRCSCCSWPNAVAGAAATRVVGALRRTPTVGIAVDMAAMENIVLVLVLRESPSSVARWCDAELFGTAASILARDVALFRPPGREIKP